MEQERIVHNLAQGSDAWHQFRLDHYGASEAAAMLGLSKNVKRNELLRMKHTGIPKEFSQWVQDNILDHGHEVEARARPLAEAVIGDELYRATISYGKLSASCDGLTMGGETAFEHKQWNETLVAMVRLGTVPDEHQPQCQQIMLVTGASRVLFMVSDGTEDNMVHTFVTPDKAWQDRIIDGWKQFDIDLAEYKPVETAPAVVAAPIEDLPALTVELVGEVKSTNLTTFQAAVTRRIKAINTDLKTDEDFATADKLVKFLEDGEKRLELVKAQALSQTSSIDELFRTIDTLKGEMKAKRLTLDKLVASRKETIRGEIVNGGRASLLEHIAKLNTRIGKPYMPVIPENFAGAIKGKRNIAGLHDAVDTELARAKIAANEIADRIQINLNTLRDEAGDYKSLFPDTAQIVLKANDDVLTLIKARIADHKAAEEKRKNDVAQQEAAAKRQAESDAMVRLNSGAPAPAVTTAAAKPVVKMAQTGPRPSDDDIIKSLADRYRVKETRVVEWLRAMDLDAVSRRLTTNVAA